jgi:hypothetical protein
MRTFIFGMLALLGVSELSKADVVSNLGNTSDGLISLGNNTITINVGALPNVGGSQWMTLTAKLFASGGTGSITGFSFILGGNTYSVSGLNIANGTTGNATVDISGANLWAVNNQASIFALTSVQATTSGSGTSAQWATTTNSAFSETAPYTFGSQTLTGAQFGVAVPEPGTFLLGGIAAIAGGWGLCWKRKRKARESSTSAEFQNI